MRAVRKACLEGIYQLAKGDPRVLFFGSDAVIAWNRFVRPFAWAQLVIMVTYHLGQLALVTALRGG